MLFYRTVAAASAMAVAAAMAALVSHPAAAAASGGTLTVNLASSTGPVLGGASGALYGLSENGVPGSDLLSPLHIETIAAGPAGGAQHPSGHTDQVAPEFFGMGGKWLLDYMQDYYSQWPYQNVGIGSYLSVVDTIAAGVRTTPDACVRLRAVQRAGLDLVLAQSVELQFRHPDDPVRRGLDDGLPADTRRRPGRAYRRPNTSVYNATVMSDFLSYAKAHDVLPDVVTWHVLEPSTEESFPADYANFLALERQDGIAPIPVDIDEYADRYQLSVPGEMVQLLAEFEDAKVYSDLPFWDIADNYSDTAVRNDEPNGQWWLMYWYGQLTGRTVAVTPPQPDVLDTLQGLSALDTAKHQARVLLADPSGGADSVKVTGIDPAVFGRAVHVSVQSIGWTGYDGSAYTPLDAAETDYRVVNGTVTVPLGELNPSDAYQVIVTPASKASVTASPPSETRTYLAADAALTDATVYSQGSQSNYNGYATAGGRDVGSIDQPGSRVAFTVSVPATGRYLMSVYYGNQTGTIAQQILRVDSGSWSFISCPPTLNWLFRSHEDVYLNLSAGTHTITFGVSDPSIGTSEGQVTMDDIQLTYAPGAVAGVTGPGTTYAAAYAGLSGRASTVPCDGPGCLAAQDIVLGSGGSASFEVDAGTDGFYRVTPAGASGHGASGQHSALTVDEARVSPGIVYLHAGINPVTYTGTGILGGLSVTPASGHATTYAASAAQNVLSGTAQVESDPYADGGQYVGWIGNGTANTLTFTGVTVPSAGTYRIMISYADADGESSGNYNTNLIDRAFTLTTSAGSSVTTYARNTYSWDQFDTVEVTARLDAGSNTIMIGNPTYYAPNVDKIIVAPASSG